MKQGTTHRPTSHLAHLYTVASLWPQEEHRQQRSWVDDFAGQFYFFPGHCSRPTIIYLIYFTLYDWHDFRNL